MFQTKEHLSAIDFSRLLLSKGISFCLYRFPGEKDFQLAVQKDHLYSFNENESGETPEFIIAPFIKNDYSNIVRLQKYDPGKANTGFQEQVEKMPDSAIIWQPLPAAITKEAYLQKIDQDLKDIRLGKLSKAILSRVILVEKPRNFDVFNFFLSLASTYPETFVSVFYIPGMGIWTGASPELLLKKEGTIYRTMALASTQPRKESGDYTWRPKEEEEHRLVQEHIEAIFQKSNCTLQSKNGPYTIETGQVA
ncbi:MAG: chorismate-binding protein, partial [Ginsengibacter sp.]